MISQHGFSNILFPEEYKQYNILYINKKSTAGYKLEMIIVIDFYSLVLTGVFFYLSAKWQHLSTLS